MTNLALFSNEIPFIAYGNSHLVVLCISLLLLALILIASKKLCTEKNLFIGRCIAVILALSVVVYTIFEIALGRFTIADDLPLSLCNLFALVAPFALWYPKHKYFEPIYFLVMAILPTRGALLWKSENAHSLRTAHAREHGYTGLDYDSLTAAAGTQRGARGKHTRPQTSP